jgi:hypothetical protein
LLVRKHTLGFFYGINITSGKMSISKRFFCFLCLIFTAKTFLANPLLAVDYPVAGDSANIMANHTRTNDFDDFDPRYLRLVSFLQEKDSLLVNYAADVIEAADANGIDWRILIAITGIESSYAKRMIPGSFNAYGWAGGYFFFDNWRSSIYYISSKLGMNYYRRGLTTPYLIGRVYAPPNPNWGRSVSQIMRQIGGSELSLLSTDRFAKLNLD